MYVMVGGEKGGAGKSTIAINLAIATALIGQRVLLVDGDNQGTSMKYIERRRNTDGVSERASPDCIHLQAHELVSGLKSRQGQYDHVFLDFAGRDSEDFRIGCGFVDVILTPLRATILDLETAEKVDAVVGQFSANNMSLKAAMFVLSQVTTHPKKRKSVVEDAAAFLGELKNFTLANSVISHRAGFENAALAGLCVTESLSGSISKDSGAAAELSALFDEVMQAGKPVLSETGRERVVA